MDGLALLKQKLSDYKRRFYLNQLLKGLLLSLAAIAIGYLALVTMEGLARFGPGVRTVLFYSAIAGFLALAGYFWVWPLVQLFRMDRSMSDDEAARQIGRYFPEVNDRLLNLIQLGRQSSADNALVAAAIEQRTKQLSVVPFTQAVPVKENRRYIPWVIFPLGAIVVLFIFLPQFLTESTTRILAHNKEFKPEAPFQFVIDPAAMKGFAGEDLRVNLKLEGRALPASAFIRYGDIRLPMVPGSGGAFSHLVVQPQAGRQTVVFEAAGFVSQPYSLAILPRPELEGFQVRLDYPAYTRKKDEVLEGVGALTVPVGTVATWQLRTSESEAAHLLLPGDSAPRVAHAASGADYTVSGKLMQTGSYRLELRNRYGANRDTIRFPIEIIADLAPQVELDFHQDSVIQKVFFIGGTAADDYGLSGLRLRYRSGTKETVDKKAFASRRIGMNGGGKMATYLETLDATALGAGAGQVVEFFVEAYDNDGVHGPKAGRSRVARLELAAAQELEERQQQKTEQAGQSLNQSAEKSRELEKQIKSMRQEMIGKKNLDFQDRKQLESLVQQQQELQKELEKLKEATKQLEQQSDQLNPKQNEEIKEKAEQLQKLIDDLLDEETKKLLEELEKLLEERRDTDETKQLLEKLQQKEQNLTKELDRALELFKQLAFEKKMEQTTEKLEELAQKQEKLAEDAAKQDKKDQAGQEKLQQEQNRLSEEFKQVEEDVKSLQEQNKGLEQPNEMPDTKQDQESVEENQEQAGEQMKQGQNQKAGKSGKQAAKQMKDMAQKMRQAQEQSEMEQTEENAEDLRKILENLLKLSFDQEELMKQFRGVNRLDPRYIAMGQKQLKLRDDAAVIEDSLYALAKRVFQLQSFVTREVGQMKQYMDEATDAFRSRRQDVASGKGQLAMTSMNNLALMLSEALDQMQQQMQQQQQSSGKSGKPKKKPGKGKPGQGSTPSLSKLQQQLNDQIQGLKKSGKTGRQMSEELARMAQQQEAIRRALEELEKGEKGGKDQKGEGGSQTGGLKGKMEETERDLVNKRITEQTIMRQRDIMTRLLEAESAIRQRGEEEKRESKTAFNYKPSVPPSFEQYLKARRQQMEMLKTLSPDLTSFYKRQADLYFRELNASAAPSR